MRNRVRLLILGVALIAAIGGSIWYFKAIRPRADVASNETTQSFVDRAALQGSGENKDSEQNVSIDSDGTIHLAPVQ